MKLYIGYPDYILDDDEFNKIHSEVRHINLYTFPRHYFPASILSRLAVSADDTCTFKVRKKPPPPPPRQQQQNQNNTKTEL